MGGEIQVKPLPYKTRQRTFGLLVLLFVVLLPFLYLYATGYRYDIGEPTNLVSTGGIFVAVDRTGAEIYIDGQLVRETRAFRKAFYAQSLDVGTHRVHVQKEGFNTWVKELPVSEHLVTEAEAFNLPLVPQVRVISKFMTSTGTMISSAPIVNASTTNLVIATTTRATTTLVLNEEYKTLMQHFGTTSIDKQKDTAALHLKDLLRGQASTTATSTEATSTVTSSGVKLYQQGDDIYATWIGSQEQMPYYYCSPDFPAYSTSTATTTKEVLRLHKNAALVKESADSLEGEILMHPIQTIPKDVVCDPTIRMDRKGEKVGKFDFLPNSTDFVVLQEEDGIYVIEIDDRAWQNVQPLMKGNNLRMHIENGNIFVYDGSLIYQVLLTSE